MARKITLRHLLGLVILVLSGLLAALVFRNYRGPANEEVISALPRNVDLSLRQIQYTETREGGRRWTLVADSAAHSAGDGVTRIENVRMTFYDENGDGEITLSAREGILTSATREVEVQGDVVVRSSRGYALYTDRLQYREATRQIRTEAPVRILSQTMEVTGKGMHLDVEKNTFVILADVKGRLSTEGREKG
jgi:LPS export ABC transporter protein LptC